MDRKNGYFEQALSDFVFDMAIGGAIRHLTDRGYSVDQIMDQLEFPTSRERVEKTVYRHLTETGMLRSSIDTEGMSVVPLKEGNVYGMNRILSEHILQNGQENSFVNCPFGMWVKKDRDRLEGDLACLTCLTGRERDYILGIRWEQRMMYHILNSRMAEISVQLFANTEMDISFYFLKEKIIFQK